MPNQHRHPAMTVRLPSRIREKAKQVLRERDWTLREFVAACLEAVARDPERIIDAVTAARPTGTTEQKGLSPVQETNVSRRGQSHEIRGLAPTTARALLNGRLQLGADHAHEASR